MGYGYGGIEQTGEYIFGLSAIHLTEFIKSVISAVFQKG